MNRYFLHHVRIVAAVHVGVLLVLVALSGWRSLFRKKQETMLPVEFVVEAPADVRKDVRMPEDPPLKPIPAPKPTPEPKRKPIERSTKRISRTPAATQKSPAPSREEIEKLLARGAKISDHTLVPNDDAQCYERIRQVLYQAWDQPSALEVGDAEASASIVLRADGRITSRTIVNGSGSDLMDASVMRALQAVPRVTGLSQSFLARHSEVTISFRLE